MSVSVFTSRDEKWVGKRREDDTTEERCKGEREHRFCLKVTGRAIGGTQIVRDGYRNPVFNRSRG